MFVRERSETVHDHSFQLGAVMRQMTETDRRDSLAARHVDVDEVLEAFSVRQIAEPFVSDSIAKGDAEVL